MTFSTKALISDKLIIRLLIPTYKLINRSLMSTNKLINRLLISIAILGMHCSQLMTYSPPLSWAPYSGLPTKFFSSFFFLVHPVQLHLKSCNTCMLVCHCPYQRSSAASKFDRRSGCVRLTKLFIAPLNPLTPSLAFHPTLTWISRTSLYHPFSQN